jgi:hypothetical protein
MILNASCRRWEAMRMVHWLLSYFSCFGLRIQFWIPAILTASIISGIVIGTRMDQ